MSSVLPAGGAARLAGLALVGEISFVLTLAVLWLGMAQGGATWLPDLAAFYTAWSMVLGGQGAHIYNLTLQARYQFAIPEMAQYRGSLLGYYNPPFVAAIFAPLASLSLSGAFWAWTVGQAVVAAGLMRCLGAIGSAWRGPERAFLFGAAIAFLPLFMNFYKGALSLGVLLGLAGAYWCLRRGQDQRAGLWLALALAKPQLLLLVVVALLAGRRWAALATLAAAGAALAAGSALLLGPRIWIDYVDLLVKSTSFYNLHGIVPHVMYNLRGVLAFTLGPERAQLISVASTVALVAGAVLVVTLWAGTWQPAHPAFGLRFAFTVALGLLVSPHAYQYDAVVLILPAALFYDYLRRTPESARGYVAFILTGIAIFSFTSLTGGGPLGVLPPIAASVLLVGWLGAALLRASTPTPVAHH